jgi:hypothetical protein
MPTEASSPARLVKAVIAMSKKKVAALVTMYNHHSHADMILGKILDGYDYRGGPGPNLQIVSMYVDQFPADDWSRGLAKKHGFTIAPTIEGALTLGGASLAVDGVLIIGEHGKYPTNAKGQILYPRRRFFEETTNAFVKYKKTVPVFNDKHLAASWTDAKWMYDRARELFVPLLAGSSLPLTWRRPVLQWPLGCEPLAAVSIGYGPIEGYGFHALEGLQCIVERRRGGETGVQAVQYLEGEEMWRAMDQGRWSKPVLEAALKLLTAHANGDYRTVTAKVADAAVFLIEYRDGLRATVPMLNGYVYEGDGGSFIFAGQLKGQERPTATLFYQQLFDPFGHFAYQVKAIESLMQTGHAGYPVERTLLTTGMLDGLHTSKAEKNRRVETPHLAIRYQPTDWPFATDAVPPLIKR